MVYSIVLMMHFNANKNAWKKIRLPSPHTIMYGSQTSYIVSPLNKQSLPEKKKLFAVFALCHCCCCCCCCCTLDFFFLYLFALFTACIPNRANNLTNYFWISMFVYRLLLNLFVAIVVAFAFFGQLEDAHKY